MTDKLMEASHIGAETKAFLTTTVGKALLEKAACVEREALDGLLNCDIRDESNQFKYRVKAMAAKNFVTWIDELISRGEQAEKQMDYEEKMKQGTGADC